MLAAIVLAWARLLRTRASRGEPHFALPRGIVLVLAGMAAIAVLAEGALLIISDGLVDVKQSGVGYMLFSIAMTIGRLTGDALPARIGDRASVFWGALLTLPNTRSLSIIHSDGYCRWAGG
jgi:hypothetical protein